MVEHEPGDRYRLSAALTLYEVEPTLRDVYVEGRTDAAFYSWFIDESHVDANVYAIDDRIYLVSDEVTVWDQSINARGRVIAFSLHCDQQLGPTQLAVTAIADSDTSPAIGPVPIASHCLLSTDDSALENYVLSERPMKKLLLVGLGIDCPSSEVIRAIIPALQGIQAVRIVLQAFNASIVEDIAAPCAFGEFATTVDKRELIRRSLTGISRRDWPGTVDDMVAWADDFEVMIATAGLSGRGHDIPALVCAYLRGRGYTPSRAKVESVLLASVELSDLADEPLFAGLIERLQPT